MPAFPSYDPATGPHDPRKLQHRHPYAPAPAPIPEAVPQPPARSARHTHTGGHNDQEENTRPIYRTYTVPAPVDGGLVDVIVKARS